MADSRLHAEILLGHALHCERSYFYAHPEQALREVEWIHYGRYLHERMAGKPTQYITGRQEFYGREFRVNRDVLIPRPETELLVELALAALTPGARVIDVGAGSGAIAATLALESKACVCAVDISEGALRVASRNAIWLGASVQFCQGDLLTGFGDASFDAVVSNPPYVASGDAAGMQREVRDWEPHLALFAGDDGLEIYRRLLPEARRVLKPGGFLAMEFGFGQSDALLGLASDWQSVEIHRDLADIPRVLTARRP